MNWLKESFSTLLSPICITFAVVIVGYYLGKIKIKGIGLDLSAILVVAVLCGLVLSLPAVRKAEAVSEIYDGLTGGLKIISSFGTALFITAVGLTTGYTFSRTKGGRVLSNFLLGVGTVAVNFLVVLLISAADKNADKFLLYGVFCGAMTSTPALSTVCENPEAVKAPIGYGAAYLFGVIGVVLFVQIIMRQSGKAEDNTYKMTDASYGTPEFGGIVQIAVSVVLGHIFSAACEALLSFSLGNTGGMLLAASLVGWLCAKKNRCIPDRSIGFIRGLGLVLFFTGTGIPAGMQLTGGFDIKYIVYGAALTVIPIVMSYTAAKKLLKYSTPEALCAVSGVMTSTPAMGVILRNRNFSSNVTDYSMTYAGALIALVVGAGIIT